MTHSQPNNNIFHKLKLPIIIFVVFWILAVVLWQVRGSAFYLLNFGTIGSAIGIGVGLYMLVPREKKPTARRLTQLLVGIYLLVFIGFYRNQNMQLEGFFFYLMAGVFSGALIHYLIAKIAGPLIFGRGFCGWACWTAMILDLLPYKQNPSLRLSTRWEKVGITHLFVSLFLVITLWFIFHYRSALTGDAALAWLVVGNVFYYGSGIILAVVLKDNRAFCKYLCPIAPILKTTSKFALAKISGDHENCTQCGECVKACPMNINIKDYIINGQRVLSSECILCMTCTTVCPQNVLHTTFNMDLGGKELLARR